MGSGLQRKLGQFADETTIHGVPDAINSHSKIHRYVWILLILAAVGMAFGLTANIWIEFFEGELGTKNLALDTRDTQFLQQEFPLVYCPSNWIDPFKVADIMRKHSVAFSAIDYGLPADAKSLEILINQLNLFALADKTYFDDWTDLEEVERGSAQQEFAKLPFAGFDEFISAISTEYNFDEVTVTNTTFRYGRRCFELLAKSAEKSSNKLSFVVKHPQPLHNINQIHVRLSSLTDVLEHGDATLDILERTGGLSDELADGFKLPYTGCWSSASLATVTDQLNMRASSHKYIQNCNHTEFSGRHRSEFPQIHCEEQCKMAAVYALAEDRFNCSRPKDWSALTPTARSTNSTALIPCNLDSHWFDNERQDVEREVVSLAKECSDACAQTECVDYSRNMGRHAQQTATFLTDREPFLMKKGYFPKRLNAGMDNDFGSGGTYESAGAIYEENMTITEDMICSHVKGIFAIFQSPNFPEKYDSNRTCYYRFEAPENHRVELTMMTAEVDGGWDRLTCFDENSENSKLGSFTGCTPDKSCSSYWTRSNIYATSGTNAVVCYFYSMERKHSSVEDHGFQMFIEAVPVESGSLPIDTILNSMRNFYYNDSVWFNHTVELHVLQLVKSEEYYLVDWIDLLSGVGGVVSLFIGSSMLSVVHLCWFWAETLWNRSKRTESSGAENQKSPKLSKFADETTIHGVPDAINSHSKMHRYVWILLILAAVGMAFGLTANIWIEYFEGELGTMNLALDTRDTQFLQQEFPLVYCPSNWIDPFKVAAIMRKHSVAFSAIDYGLSLIPADAESLEMLVKQLTMFTRVGDHDYYSFTHEEIVKDKQARSFAQLGFNNLPFAGFDEFIGAISTEYNFDEVTVTNTTFRYGRRCFELLAKNAEKSSNKLSFVVKHPQPQPNMPHVRVSSILGDLRFNETILGKLERSAGLSNDLADGFSLPYTSWSYNTMLSSVTDQLSIRASSHKYIQNCNHTEFSGRHRSEFPQIHCEEQCKMDAVYALAEDRFNCSKPRDWGAFTPTARSTNSTALIPCNLDSHWFDNERQDVEREVVSLAKECSDACAQTECVDYIRNIAIHAQQDVQFEDALGPFIMKKGFFPINFWGKVENHFGSDGNSSGTIYKENMTVSEDMQCSNVKSSFAIFQSPNFPERYYSDTICYYRFEAPKNHRVKLTMVTAEMEEGWDRLTCFDENSANITIGTFTGCTPDQDCDPEDTHDNVNAYSKTNVVICCFYSGMSGYGVYQGFQMLLQPIPVESGAEPKVLDTMKDLYYNDSVWFNHTVELHVLQLVKSEEYYLVDWIDLLSGVGGVVSLFIGSSMLSVVHLCWFWAEALWNRSKRTESSGAENQKSPKLSKFADETTIHGVPDAINSHSKIHRYVWILLILAGVGMAFGLTANIWIEFFENHLGTKNIVLDTRDLQVIQQEFPLVYCPSNWIDPFKVADIMRNHSVAFSAIDYGLSLIPADVESLEMLVKQLDVIAMLDEYEYYNLKQRESTEDLSIAQLEFAKLSYENLDEFIDEIATEYNMDNVAVLNRTFRYGRRCFELEAESSSSKSSTLDFVIRHPQPLLPSEISVRVSPISGDLQFSNKALEQLDKSVGLDRDSAGSIVLPRSSRWIASILASATDRLTIRASSNKYIQNCNHTEFSGRHRSEFPQIHCEEQCKVAAVYALAEDRFNCSRPGDWGALTPTARSTNSTALLPCNLDSHWFDNERQDVEREVVSLSKECSDACAQTECVDYSRNMGIQSDQEVKVKVIFDTGQSFHLAKGYFIADYAESDFGTGGTYDKSDGIIKHNITAAKDMLCSQARGRTAIFESPNFPNDYDPNTFCFYRFEAPEQHRVKMTMLTAEVEEPYDHLTCFDENLDPQISTIGTWTGCTPDQEAYCDYAEYTHDNVEAYSETNVVVCYFYTDDFAQRMGFQMLLQAVPLETPPIADVLAAMHQFYYNESVWFNHTVELHVLQLVKSEEYYLVDWIDLLSGVGGVVSLFIGSSMLSVVHLCWFWAEALWNRIN